MKQTSKTPVVVMGGGTGPFTVLSGLKEYQDLDISAIITVADNGGSSGVLRDQYGIIPPGDLGQALAALSSKQNILRKLLSHRFVEGDLKGHSFANILLLSLTQVYGDVNQAIKIAEKMLDVTGHIIPVTTDSVHLHAKTTIGRAITGERNIEEHLRLNLEPLDHLWLEPAENTINPLARSAIENAKLIVIGPGSVFTSIIPLLLVNGVTDALKQSAAKIVYVTNLMTEIGQNNLNCVQDFAGMIEKYLGSRHLDYVLYNTATPSTDTLERYRQQTEREPVQLDQSQKMGSYKLIAEDLLDTTPATITKGDALAATRSLIRHDSAKLAKLIYTLR